MTTDKTLLYDSRDYCDEDYDIMSWEFENVADNCDAEKQSPNAIITGTLGLWDGRHDIMPVETETVKEALNKCLGSCDHIAIWSEGEGLLYVETYHHDGTNQFQIKY